MNNTTKLIIWVVVIVVVIWAGYALFNKKEPFDAAQGKPIKIGAVYQLSGSGQNGANKLLGV